MLLTQVSRGLREEQDKHGYHTYYLIHFQLK